MASQLLLAASGLMTFTVGLAQSAPADSPQMAPAESTLTDEIIVTGSRILKPEIQSASPLATISAEDIKLTGAINAEQFLNQLPQAVPGNFSSTTNNGADGSSSVQLRGLGEERTLVLVDGRRFIPKDGTGVADINAIPVGLIERTEVLTGGASSVYGSDALAGVVNFIMKDDFEGAQLDVNYGQYQEGDGDSLDLMLTLGANTADGRGNVTVYGGYTRREAVFSNARSGSEFSLNSATDDDGNIIPGILLPGGSINAIPTNVFLSDPAIDLDGDGVVTVNANGQLVDGINVFNFQGVNYLEVPQDRYLVGGMGKFEINENLEVYSRVAYSNTQVTAQLAPLAVFFQDTYRVNLDNNAYLSPGDAAALINEANGDVEDGNYYVGIGRRLEELGGRTTEYQRSAFQLLAGFRGEVIDSWNYDAFIQRSQTDESQSYGGDASIARIQQALLAVDNGNGPECQDPSGGCSPLNVWTSAPGAITPAAIGFIGQNLSATRETQQTIYGLSFSGDLGTIRSPLADSPIGLAVGYEYRDEQSNYRPDQNLATGNSAAYGEQPPIQGEFDVRELFVETNVPIVENRPGIRSLSAEAGYRWSNYSSGADVTNTYKVGLVYAPVERFRVRGMYQRAVRAPNINDLFEPSTESAESASDPCAGNLASAGSLYSDDPVVQSQIQALCEATGVPAGYYAGGGDVPDGPAGQIQGFLGGNENLVEESSDTYTIGFVATPLDNLTLTLDYYSIDIENAIDNTPAADALANCYNPSVNSALDPNDPSCTIISRGASNGALFGTGLGIELFKANFAAQSTSGVDFSVNWQVEPSFMPGTVGVGLLGTWVDTFKQQSTAAATEYECAGTWGLICGAPIPELALNLQTTWSLEGWVVSARLRYIDSINYDLLENGQAADTSRTEIPAQTYVDLSATYALNDQISFLIGADNIFNNDPPLLDNDFAAPTNNGNGNTFPATYDALGIWFYGGATVKF